MEKKKKTVRRLLPYPIYDASGLCGWLEDMARQGLFLKENGINRFIFMASFERGEPRALQYHADPGLVGARNRQSWQFVSKCGQYEIFRAEPDCTAPLCDDTLPAANGWKRFASRALFSSVFSLLPCGILTFTCFKVGTFSILARTEWMFFLILFCLAFSLYSALVQPLNYFRLAKKQNEEGSFPVVRRSKLRKLLHSSFWVVALLLATYALVGTVYELQSPEDKVENRPDLPFAALAEFSSDESLIADGDPSYLFQERRGLLYPRYIFWKEGADWVAEDESDSYVNMWMEYHEAGTQWLAEQLAEEYYRKDHLNITEYRELDASQFGADRVWLGIPSYPVMLIQSGKTVMRIRFFTNSDKLDNDTMERWVRNLIASLPSES